MNQRSVGRASPASAAATQRTMPAILPQPCNQAQLPEKQRGVALVVALILLVVITLIGLAAVSGTIMQSKMAANQYDRQTAFQNAASALRAAQQQLLAGNFADVSSRKCGRSSGSACLANPFTDSNLPANSIYPVVAGSAPGQYTAGPLATGQPEYVIEDMGDWLDPTLNTGGSHVTKCHQAGGVRCGVGAPVTYYRITARSGDPATVGDRAIVTLQAVFKQH